ncbi:hypothetical protein JEZ13_07335 [bacterium]|nr:hypothetical protein [bacterium]
MKRGIFIAVSLLAVVGLFAEISINFSNKSTYSDNVFQLSDGDLDIHDSGSGFDYIETSDDIINSTSLSIYSRNQVGKIRYDFYVRGTYDAYLKNSDKSKPSISTGFGINTRNFNSSIMYGYYPDSYVRKYRDKDGTQEYEKFEYDKNLYKVDAEYRFTRKAYLLGYLKFEQYYHNEYFTEYDGDAITPGLGLKYSFSELYLEGWYYYRNYETHEEITPDDEISDQSYESNIYTARLRMKKIRTKKFDYRPVFDFSYEKRYYDGWDKYHNGREDDTITINPWVKFYFTDYLNITLDYTSKIRNVSSSSQSVEDSKSYQENQMSISFEVPIKF